MINLSLFRQCIKANIKFFFVFTLILCTFLVVMCNVFTPQTVHDLEEVTKGSVLGNIFGNNGTLISFMSNSFYALMAIVFPMVYSIMVGNRLIAEKVDRGSMACYLSTPLTRNKITITSAFYLIVSLAVMWGIATGVGYAAAQYFQEGALDVTTFLMMNVGCFLYHFVISSICFCSSCICNTSKGSLTLGAGIPLAFFVISLFMKLGNGLDFLKYVTLNTLFDTQKIIEGNGYLFDFYWMIGIGLVLYMIGILVFHKKDLPL